MRAMGVERLVPACSRGGNRGKCLKGRKRQREGRRENTLSFSLFLSSSLDAATVKIERPVVASPLAFVFT